MKIFSKELLLNQYEWKIQNIEGNWRGGCKSNGVSKYIIVGASGEYLESQNAINWTKYQIGGAESYNFSAIVSPFTVLDFAAGDEILTVGSSTSNLWDYFTITNGVNWNGATFGNNKYLAVGTSGTTAYATPVNAGQTLTWTITSSKLSPMTSPQFVDYIDFLSLYLAGGNGAYFSTSTNASTWTTPSRIGSNTSIYWQDSATNGSIVAMLGVVTSGSGSTYLTTTTDGSTWTNPVLLTSGFYPRSIEYHNGQWLICGSSGYVMASSDLSVWKTEITSPAASWYKIIPANTGWVLAGTNYIAFREY